MIIQLYVHATMLSRLELCYICWGKGRYCCDKVISINCSIFMMWKTHQLCAYKQMAKYASLTQQVTY
jgi:hypothetical protein